jgi:hypothetical protein
MRRWKFGGVISLFMLINCVAALAQDATAWPPITQQNQQWTRWWWLGSAVDPQNITHLLEQYQQAGIGGVEICPIYGAYGYENRYIPYLSSKWMDMLAWTSVETNRLGMGMDLTTGTGWPMGGPEITPRDASSNNIGRRYEVAGGSEFKEDLTTLPTSRPVIGPPANTQITVQAVMAFSDDGQKIDLTSQVNKGSIDWTAPAGNWRVYTVVRQAPVMLVKRPAPNGEGSVLDPFSVKAMNDYLSKFNKAFTNYTGILPRAQFHDSYEYVGDDTPDLLSQFQLLRGYDLRDQLPALYGDGPPEQVTRVICDYRQTMADLHMAYVKQWVDWCHAHNMLAREQAHGAPANLLDLYAEADIPETETFGNAETAASDQNFPMNKFASSAAHVTGKQLASSESFTWLGQHFQVSWADVKPAADYLMLSGINHMFFHGIAYSPQDVPWPGWLFYASVDFNPNGGLWHDMPAYNAYVAHCQSILQYGKPSNDVLLYFPVYDLWQTPAGRTPLIDFVIGGQWLRGSAFYATALALQGHGFGVDYISDAQLASASFSGGVIVVGGTAYRAIVVPTTRIMPPETMAHLLALTKAGAIVVFQKSLPSDVPGAENVQARTAALNQLTSQINLPRNISTTPQGAPYGLGTIWLGDDVDPVLDAAGVAREPMLDSGLEYIRRTNGQGYNYFIANRGQQTIDRWMSLATPCKSVVILDPMFPDRVGFAATRKDPVGRTQVYLQLKPDESCFLRTFTDSPASTPAWNYWRPATEAMTIDGTWNIHFIDGGPALPPDITTDKLASWTTLGGADAKRFAGTGRYSTTFNVTGDAPDWLLNLGQVCESARVRVNGRDAGTLFAQPFEMHIGSLVHPGQNTLEIEVTNLAANRIHDLDQRGVKWRIFRDINIVSPGAYAPFDASTWPLRDSGLLGPVKLTPLASLNPAEVP